MELWKELSNATTDGPTMTIKPTPAEPIVSANFAVMVLLTLMRSVTIGRLR